MTAKELAEYLLKNPDMRVIQSSDAEGNEYSEVCDIEFAYIEKGAEGRIDGIWTDDDLVDEYEDDEDEIAAVRATFEKVIVIYPV